MKRWTILAVAICLGVLLFNSVAIAQQSGKVLMIVSEGKSADLELMLTKEVGVMRDMLTQAGFTVVSTTVSGESISAETVTLTPDMKLSEVNVADYAGYILPCLAISTANQDPAVIDLAKQAAAEGKPMAAQTSSVVILGKAGVLSGKKYAYRGLHASLKDAINSGNGVVQDGKIITSGFCPYLADQYRGVQDGTSNLTQAFIAELKK